MQAVLMEFHGAQQAWRHARAVIMAPGEGVGLGLGPQADAEGSEVGP